VPVVCAVHGETIKGKFYLIRYKYNKSYAGPPPAIPICVQAYKGIPVDARLTSDGSYDVNEAQAGDERYGIGDFVCMISLVTLSTYLNNVPYKPRPYW
jgi:hypothetical protein